MVILKNDETPAGKPLKFQLLQTSFSIDQKVIRLYNLPKDRDLDFSFNTNAGQTIHHKDTLETTVYGECKYVQSGATEGANIKIQTLKDKFCRVSLVTFISGVGVEYETYSVTNDGINNLIEYQSTFPVNLSKRYLDSCAKANRAL
jgi:hypothetical protein